MDKEYILKSPPPPRDLHIDYKKELNEQQYEAVTSPAGPSLVIAGAGSGKTRTLTYRVAWLMEHGVSPDNILLLTFTNKAAKEMLLRVQSVLPTHPASAGRLWGGTFHSVGARVLRRHAKLLGYGSDFTILDRDDSKDLLDAILKEAKVNTAKDKFPKANVLIEIFSLAVNTEKPFEQILTEQYPYFLLLAPALERFREVYAERKRKNNAMDFDDLLALWLRLLQEHAEVRDFYAQKFQAILVDEYQDTNKIQADIVDALASAHRNVMAVGDDSQSIYSWRGANFQNIISFPERYGGNKINGGIGVSPVLNSKNTGGTPVPPSRISQTENSECQVFKIESNYRSTPQILMTANAAIRPNPNQYPKELHAVRKAGAKPALIVCADGRQEAAFVAQRVIELQEEGVALNEIAVLYRAHFHSMELQMELTRRNMPFVINSGIRFFEQAHVKDVAAFLRLSVNPTDELSFKRIAKMLPGIGGGTAEKLWNRISDNLVAQASLPVASNQDDGGTGVSPVLNLQNTGEPSPRDATPKAEQTPVPPLGNLDEAQARRPMLPNSNLVKMLSAKHVLSAVPAKAAKDWQQLGHTFEQVLAENSCDVKIRIIVEAMYDDYLKENFEDYGNRRDDLQRLAEFSTTFGTMQEFLEQMALLTNVDAEPRHSSVGASMWLSTVHQAKGLEWHTVFIVGLADEMFPSIRSLEVRGGEEEERRLFYVAITRAKDELYLSFPMTRGGRGGDFGMNRPSRFIKEIPTTLLQAWKISINLPRIPQSNPRRPVWEDDEQRHNDD